MEELLACRTCLITDVKLYDMFKYNLVKPYAVLTGTEDLGHTLPRHMCGICASLLLKCVTFQMQCDTAQRVLRKALTKECELTMPFLRSIDRSLYSFRPALTFTPIEQNSYNHEVKIDNIKKDTDFETSDEVEIEVGNIKQDVDETQDVSTSENYDEIDSKVENYDEDVCVLCDYFGVDKCDEMTEEFENELVNEKVEKDDDYIKVVTLSKEQQIEELEKVKESLQYLTAKYKCDKCYKSYNIEYMYRAHMTHHDPASGALICDVCQRRYTERHQFNNHARSHERRYECQMCPYVSPSLSLAKSHVAQSHKEVQYRCEPCGKSFTAQYTYYTHKRTKHAEHRCELCGEPFTNLKGLRRHHVLVHVNKVEALKNCKDNVCLSCKTRFESQEALDTHKGDAGSCNTELKPCVVCGAGFETETELKEHKITHRRKASIKCQECDKTFSDRYSYRAHYKESHFQAGSQDPPSRQKTDAVCEVCGKICRTAFGLRAHQARAHAGRAPRKTHVCAECGQAFATSNHLAVHIRRHTGERPFQCEYCSKAFYTRPALIQHTRIHTGEKPFLCEHCGKSFRQSKTRKIHIMGVHKDVVGGQRHACTLCPSSFKLACYLKDHMKRHTGEKPYKNKKRRLRPNTGEKPYKCKICTKSFWSKGAMYTHNSLKHRGPFSCTECSMVFERFAERKTHILKDHRGKKVYSCPHCDQVFGYSWSRNDHVATQHLGTKPRGAKKKGKPAETETTDIERENETSQVPNTKKLKLSGETKAKKRNIYDYGEDGYTFEAQESEYAAEPERRYVYVEAGDRQYLVVSNEDGD